MSSEHSPRILVIGPTPPPYNGVSVVMDTLLSSDIAKKFELVLLDTADRRGLTNVGRFDWHNVTLALRHGLAFLWLLIPRRPDIIYIPIAQGTLGYLRDCLFLVPSRLLGHRVIVHLHGSDFREFYQRSSVLMKKLIRWTLGKVRRGVVLGESLRGVFAGLVPADRVAVVPNGIEPVPAVGDKAPLVSVRPGGYRQILYLSNLIRHKGFIDVLHTIPLVLREEPKTRFILAGDLVYPEEIQEARGFIGRNHLHGFVKMPGVVVGDEKARLLHESTLFVFPPITPEGQPLVILEAMSAGLPIIATPQGAIPEMVADGENGFLVPAEDPAAIADRILLLLHDEDLRRRMGEASRERFAERYTLDRWTKDLACVFHEVYNEDRCAASVV